MCLHSYSRGSGLWLLSKLPLVSYICHIMRKPAFVIGKQQRHRSACAYAQSYLCLYYSLLAISKNSRLASFWSRVARFESHLVGNLKDRFSCHVAYNVGKKQKLWWDGGYAGSPKPSMFACMMRTSLFIWLLPLPHRKSPHYPQADLTELDAPWMDWNHGG